LKNSAIPIARTFDAAFAKYDSLERLKSEISQDNCQVLPKTALTLLIIQSMLKAIQSGLKIAYPSE